MPDVYPDSNINLTGDSIQVGGTSPLGGGDVTGRDKVTIYNVAGCLATTARPSHQYRSGDKKCITLKSTTLFQKKKPFRRD